MELLSAVSGDDRFKEAAKDLPKGERKTMRLAYLDKVEKRGDERATTRTWAESVRNVMKNMKLSAQQAMDLVSVPVDLRNKVLKQL